MVKQLHCEVDQPSIINNSESDALHMPSIEVQQLSKRFENSARTIFSELSFTLSSDESLCLLGPSGCGKTTLLRLLMGLERPSSGTIHIVPQQGIQMSYVFQEPRLVPWRTCLENVLLPLELTSQNNSSSRTHALELLQQLGLANRLTHFPHELSGGMQMRVALARALITQPKIVLLDEPFAALDERSRFRMQDILLKLKTGMNLQYVFVTHSISEAVYLGDRILLMDNTGRAKDCRTLTFGERNQSLKLTPAFNAVLQTYAQLFGEMEHSMFESDVCEAPR
jgi:NitT/TauT family transport system ATP-binding protein